MLKFDKSKVITPFLLALLTASFVFVNLNIDVSASESEDVYLHSEKPLVPVHMRGPPLEPVHIHSEQGLVNLTDPWETFWHELYPNYCNNYILNSWEDTGAPFGQLSPSDQIDMIDEETGELSWYHVDRMTFTLYASSEPPECWYTPPYKPPFPDYAPAGMPDFDERQWGTYNWTYNGRWSHCGPVAVANSLWWLDSEYESLLNPSPVPPPTISDSFPMVQNYSASWDDHHPNNTQPLVEHLAWLMDCDGRRTTIDHEGTNVFDMEAGLAQYLSWSGVNPLGDVNGDGVVDSLDNQTIWNAYGSKPGDSNWNLAADIYPETVTGPGTADNKVDIYDVLLMTSHWGETGLFYEHTVERPDFYFIEEEVERCQDVVLLLGFWIEVGPGEWYREFGHYVTVSGVDSVNKIIYISDPIKDAFENGLTPMGRVPIPHIHPPPEPPYITHNNASYVSHDGYNVIYEPCPGGDWSIEGYPEWPGRVQIEYAVITSPRPQKMAIELKEPDVYEEWILYEPVCTLWHEVWPNYSNVYHIVEWKDDGDGVLGYCDYIRFEGSELWWHVDDVATDLILNKKITDPVCTEWHELHPEFCQPWHLTSWEDTNWDGLLSPCDQIDMENTSGVIHWFHVDRVTLTLNLSWIDDPTATMYIEYKGPFEDMYSVKTEPNCTLWHEVYPDYSNTYHITNWTDNCNGVLSYCDYIELDKSTWWHVEEVSIDLILNEKIADPTCTYWHELYPKFCNEYHIEGWKDNDGNRLLSPCDNVTMMLQPDGPTLEYHVENVTLTLNVSVLEPPGPNILIEFAWGYEDMYWAKIYPEETEWHAVYPPEEFCKTYYLWYWEDNCNGVLSYCDYITLYDPDSEVTIYCHVEEVAVDMVVKPPPHDVAVAHVSSLYPWVYQGEVDPISVTVTNEGGYAETVDVFAFYDGNLAAPKQTVVLNPGQTKILTFHWDTTGVPPGNYTVSANATIPIDDDPADNYLSDGKQEVKLLPWYVKPPYPDYAPSGMPDFDQRQWGTYNWTGPWGKWSHCGPLACANSLWWYDSKYESIYNTNPAPPPTISDSFTLVQSYNPGVWDDHDPQNVPPLVEHLAWLMNCNGNRTGPVLGRPWPWAGTYVYDMEAGLAHYLSWSGVNPLGDVNGDGVVNQTDVDIVTLANNTNPGMANWNLAADVYPETVTGPYTADNLVNQSDIDLVKAHLNETGMFYEHTAHGKYENMEFFYYIEEEVERSQDVVLLLGFYYGDTREGGHYVTVAGVNSTTIELLISNPCRDDFEAGKTPGRSPVRHIHPPPEPPYTTHNNASLVSQDAYRIVKIPHPSGYDLALEGYFNETWKTARIEYAVITSPLGTHDVAITDITTVCQGYKTDKTVVCQGFTANINVTVTNPGDFTENVNVALWAQNVSTYQVDAAVPVTLNPGASVNITFLFNATKLPKANYTIFANVTMVPGETNTADNTYVDATISVTILGDVNADCLVDMKDIAPIAARYGANIGTARYVANYDLTDDGTIDMKDIAPPAAHYGDTGC